MLPEGIFLLSAENKAAAMAKKESVYKLVRVVGFISLVPITLAAGPFAGYLTGDLVQKKFGAPYFVLVLFVILGIAGSIFETIKILKAALWTEEHK